MKNHLHNDIWLDRIVVAVPGFAGLADMSAPYPINR